jgi:hypothetical protein
MTAIRSGTLTALFLYDVAEAARLGDVGTAVASAVPARLAPRPDTPAYIQYVQPPLTIDGEALGLTAVEGSAVRFKVFDYGVISVAISRPLPESWPELLHLGLRWHDDPALAASAERCGRELVSRIRGCLDQPIDTWIAEDYLVFGLHELEGTPSADDVLRVHGQDIARLLRGEHEPLSGHESEEVLRHRLSYLASDLVIPTWNAAFVYDTEPNAQAPLEILEYANSQLLQFRAYDGLLDRQLARIYAQLQAPGWWGRVSRSHARAARELHSIFIDVNELTDRTENALKIVGDVYAARLFTLAAARLGLDQWKASVQEKLATLDSIYRFAVEQASLVRGEFLEVTVVLILLFELVFFVRDLLP